MLEKYSSGSSGPIERLEKIMEGGDGERRNGAILAWCQTWFIYRADVRSLPGVAFIVGPIMNGCMAEVGFSASMQG